MPKRYVLEPENKRSCGRSRVRSQRVHFKNTHETVRAVQGMTLKRAKVFLYNVLRKQEAVPFRTFTGGCSRDSQGKRWKHSQVRWPTKSVYAVLALLKNAEKNAIANGLEKKKLYVAHAHANRAPKIRRRTFRAHGRINPYMASPSHIELILREQEDTVSEPKEEKKDRKAHV